MNKLVYTIFFRAYLSIVTVLIITVSVMVAVSDKYLDEDDVADFQRDTFYILGKMTSEWESLNLSPEEYFDKHGNPISFNSFKVRWSNVEEDFSFGDIRYLSTENDAKIFLVEDDVYLAIYELNDQKGYLAINDSLPLVFDNEVYKTPFFFDPEYLVPFIILLTFLLSLGVSIYFPIVTLLKQIENIVKVQNNFSNGDLFARADENIPYPMKKVAINFNKMAGRICETINKEKIISQALPHEVRTPLSRIQLAVGILRRVDDIRLNGDLLNDIDGYVDDLKDLSEKIVTLSKLSYTVIDKKHPVIDIVRFVNARIEKLRLDDNRVEVLIAFSSNLTRECNEAYLRLVLDNIISNALKYARNQVVITHKETIDYDLICFDNDGSPIPKEKEKEIFMPFSRLEECRSRDRGGFGLGLSIAKSAARELGGDLKLENSELHGAKFTLYLKK